MKIPEAIRQDKNIKWILLMGLLQTAACAVTYWFRISNPNFICGFSTVWIQSRYPLRRDHIFVYYVLFFCRTQFLDF